MMLTVPASAQALNRWIVNDQPGNCGMLTTMDRQAIPTLGFGLSAESRDTVTVLIKGNMNHDGVQPRTAEIRFGDIRSPAKSVGIFLLEQPDIYGITIALDVTHLRHFAEAPSFSVYLDDEFLTSYSLAERGEMVANLARCMRRLP